MVAFRFHMDRLFGEAPTRETNAAGYLIRIHESTPQSEPGSETGKKGDLQEHECKLWSSTIPAHAGRLDLVRIGKNLCPPDLELVARFILLHKIFLFFFSGARISESA